MKRRLILITIDCLRKDHLGLYGYPEPITPNIDKLGLNSIIFQNAIANGSYTPSSFFSIFTSNIPGIDIDYTLIPRDIIKFPEKLQNNGIKTCAIHSNPHLGKISNFHIGFDAFFDMYEEPEYINQKKRIVQKIIKWLAYFGLNKKEIFRIKKVFKRFITTSEKDSLTAIKENAPYLDAKGITQKVINWLDLNYNSSFFLWVHYMDAHRPYFPPSEYIKKLSNTDISDSTKIYLRDIINEVNKDPNFSENLEEKYKIYINILYNAEILYVDHFLGILFQYLKNLGIYEDVNIIITADHGEALFEHNLLGHQANVFDELLQVPLVMKLDNYKGNQKRINDLVELLDVAPSILDIFNISVERNFNGVSLIPLILGDNTFSHRDYVISSLLHKKEKKLTFLNRKEKEFQLIISCRTNDWKLIYDSESKEYKLFNLNTDPQELTDLSSNEDDKEMLQIEKQLREKIRSHMKVQTTEKDIIKRTIRKIKFNNY